MGSGWLEELSEIEESCWFGFGFGLGFLDLSGF